MIPTRLSALLIPLLAGAVFSTAMAADQAPASSYQGLAQESLQHCAAGPTSMCWKPAADHLSQLAAPRSAAEREDQLMAWYMLAKMAYLAADHAESARFYAKTIELAHSVVVDGDSIEAAVNIDAAMLHLSARDYPQALALLDKVLSALPKDRGNDETRASVSLMRAGALIGLKRADAADLGLRDVLDKLDFDGIMPFESWPFGPQALDPYASARRIAAHYQKEGKFEQTLALLASLDTRRQQALQKSVGASPMARPWAAHVDPADILDEEAAAYLAQGRDAAAEPLLRQSLALREKTGGNKLKHVLARLAGSQRRAGNTAAADAINARAAGIAVEKNAGPVDPLADTLPLPD